MILCVLVLMYETNKKHLVALILIAAPTHAQAVLGINPFHGRFLAEKAG